MIKAWTRGPFTGRHFFAVMVAFFGVVIAVNVFLAREASATFGGEVVENSYVASQRFNTWLDEAAKERALGWKASLARQSDGRLAVTLKGAPADRLALVAELRHPLGTAPDRALAFSREGDRFVSTEPVPQGRWTVRIEAHAGATRWRDEQTIG